VSVTGPSRFWPAVGSVLRRHWALLGGYAVLLAGWYIAYRASSTSALAAAPSLSLLADQLVQGFGQSFLPSLFGGPWHWLGGASGYRVIGTPSWVALLCTLLALAGATILAACGPRARRVLLLVVLYAVAGAILVNVGRQGFVGITGTLPRYFADLTVVSVFALALATSTLVRDPAPQLIREISPPRPGRSRRRAIVAAAIGGQLLLLLSSYAFAEVVLDDGTAVPTTWSRNALASLQKADASVPVLDEPVSTDVLWPLAYPYNYYSWFFAGVDDVPSFRSVVPRLYILDGAGQLVEAHIQGPVSREGPVRDCGWVVTQERPSTVPMSTEIINWSHTMQLAYIASGPGRVEVRMGEGAPVTVPVSAGLNDAFFDFGGGGRSVTIRVLTPGTTVCVGTVRVGAPTPGPLPAS
jgi:hypothetical protein